MRPIKITRKSRAERNTMNAVLIISILLLAFTAFALYRWPRRPSNEDTQPYFVPRSGGLFSDQAAVSANASLTCATIDNRAAEQRAALLARAAEGDQAVLAEAHAISDADFYREVLDVLTGQA